MQLSDPQTPMVSFLLGGKAPNASARPSRLSSLPVRPAWLPVQAPSCPTSDKQPEREETHPHPAGLGPEPTLHLTSSPACVPSSCVASAHCVPGLGLGTILRAGHCPGLVISSSGPPVPPSKCRNQNIASEPEHQSPAPFKVGRRVLVPPPGEAPCHLCCPQPPPPQLSENPTSWTGRDQVTTGKPSRYDVQGVGGQGVETHQAP